MAKLTILIHIRTSKIKIKYYFFKDLERIVFIELSAVDTMRFLR